VLHRCFVAFVVIVVVGGDGVVGVVGCPRWLIDIASARRITAMTRKRRRGAAHGPEDVPTSARKCGRGVKEGHDDHEG
jgi:hypothetical protein